MEQQFIFATGDCKSEYTTIRPISLENLEEFTGLANNDSLPFPTIGNRNHSRFGTRQVTIDGQVVHIPQVMSRGEQITDCHTQMQTVVNGQVVLYSESPEKLYEICRKTWPDRELVLVQHNEDPCGSALFSPETTVQLPSNVITVTKTV